MPKKIAILSGPRCGKATLVQQLHVDLKIRDLDVGVAAEHSTDYLRDKGMIENIAEQYGIYLGQLHLEESLNDFDYTLTDYATFVPCIYAKFMLGDKKGVTKEIKILRNLYVLALRDLLKYDRTFFVPREFGYSENGVRWQDEEVTQAVDKAILSFLETENVRYTGMARSAKERTGEILDIVGISQEINLDMTK